MIPFTFAAFVARVVRCPGTFTATFTRSGTHTVHVTPVYLIAIRYYTTPRVRLLLPIWFVVLPLVWLVRSRLITVYPVCGPCTVI